MRCILLQLIFCLLLGHKNAFKPVRPQYISQRETRPMETSSQTQIEPEKQCLEIQKSLTLDKLKSLHNKVKTGVPVHSALDEMELILSSSDEKMSLKHGMLMINIYKSFGKVSEAFKIVDRLLSEGIVADTFIYNNLIDGCARTGDCALVEHILEHMTTRGVLKDHKSYSSAMSAYSKAGNWERVMELWGLMKNSGLEPDTICYSTALSACASSGRLREAIVLFLEMKKNKVEVNKITS